MAGFSGKRTVAAVVAAIAAAAAACAAVARFTSAPLSRSVQNESDAAIDRACAWLASLQDKDGSWNGDIELTSVVILALAGSGQEQVPGGGMVAGESAIGRATDWLIRSACDGVGLPARAWRDIALAALAPESVASATNALPYATGISTNDACAIRRRASFLGIDDDGTPGKSQFACDPVFRMLLGQPPDAATAAIPGSLAGAQGLSFERAFWFAHAVNLASGGNLYTDGAGDLRALDWRADIANLCTTSQKIGGCGHGNWNNSPRDTAFAVLLLKEL